MSYLDEYEGPEVAVDAIKEAEQDTSKYAELPYDENGLLKFTSIDGAIRAYVEERDRLRITSAAFNLEEKVRKDRMKRMSMWLRDKGDEMCVDSFKTGAGTAYRNVKTSYRVRDFPAFFAWVVENNKPQCLEKRVAKLATKEIHDATGEIPPGLDFAAEVEFDVRRPVKAKE
jgi:hypothetical protein